MTNTYHLELNKVIHLVRFYSRYCFLLKYFSKLMITFNLIISTNSTTAVSKNSFTYCMVKKISTEVVSTLGVECILKLQEIFTFSILSSSSNTN